MEVELIKRYTINCLETVSIPEKEFIEVKELDEKLLIQVVNKAFAAIECHDVVVEQMLISPEIDKLFSKTFGREFYDKRKIGPYQTTALWTADVRIVEGLDCVVFIGKTGDIISWDTTK